MDVLAVLAKAADVDAEDYRAVSVHRSGDAAVHHLMAVAAGMESQIFGDDQIVSQVRGAAALAREAGTMDAVLDTLFRRAVTAGKRVRTETRLTGVPASAAAAGVRRAETFFGTLREKKAVVIGNGEMGRLAAAALHARGAAVTVTLRTYRHGETVVPSGCAAWPYDQRYELMGGAEQMTQRAVRALEQCDCVAGYGLYLPLIDGLLRGKERIQTGMTRAVAPP